MAKLLNCVIKRRATVLFQFREAVVDFSLDITDRVSNTVQVDIPMMSANVKILTNAAIGTYDTLKQGDTVLVYSDEGGSASAIKMNLQTATHYVTRGQLELVCNRQELTDKVPFKGMMYVAPGLSDVMLDKVSIEGDTRKITKKYDTEIYATYKSDYAVAIAWSRPWLSSNKRFRPDSIALLPYLGQLTRSADKTVELFDPGTPDQVTADAPVYYIDASCIVDMDIESAQPPVTDIEVKTTEVSGLEVTFSAKGYVTRTERPAWQGGATYSPHYPQFLCCPEEGISMLVDGNKFMYSDGMMVVMPRVDDIAYSSSADIKYARSREWGYTDGQFDTLLGVTTGSWGQPSGYEYRPAGVSSQYVFGISESLIVVFERKTMKVLTQLTNSLGHKEWDKMVHKCNDTAGYEAFVFPINTYNERSQSAFALVHNKNTDAWTMTWFYEDTGTLHAPTAWTSALHSPAVQIFAAVIAYATYNDDVLTVRLHGYHLSDEGNVIHTPRTFQIGMSLFPYVFFDSIKDIQMRYLKSGEYPRDDRLLITYYGDSGSSYGQGYCVGCITLTQQSSSSTLYTSMRWHKATQSGNRPASFLGIYPYENAEQLPPQFLPYTGSALYGDVKNTGAVDEFFVYATYVKDVNGTISYVSYDVKEIVEDADTIDFNKIYLTCKTNKEAKLLVSMFYDTDPFSAVSPVSETYSVHVADAEENLLTIPGLMNSIDVNRDSIDKDKGRVRITIQKVGHSEGRAAGDPYPEDEYPISELPVLATGAYVKVYPSGKYGSEDMFVMKVTGYSLSYSGVATAVVTGIIVGDALTPPTVVYEYYATNIPSWVWNDDCKVFAWVWGGQYGTGEWIRCTKDTVSQLYFETLNSQIQGFKLCRCQRDTTVPQWNYSGDWPGAIYNVTGDITCSNNQFTYNASTWYSYTPS